MTFPNWNGQGRPSTIDLIKILRNEPSVTTVRRIWTASNPIVEYGTRTINGTVLPAYIVAEINNSNTLDGTPRPSIPSNVTANLARMGMQNLRRNPDEAGHLLAHQLGGPTNELYNFVPMTRILNRGAGSTAPRGNKSVWFRVENEFKDFFNQYHSGKVLWKCAVMYSTNNNPWPNRPTEIFASYDLDYQGNSNISEDSPVDQDTCFSNNPNDTELVYS